MCVQSPSCWLACDGVSGEAPRGRSQISTGYRGSGQHRCHDSRGLQSRVPAALVHHLAGKASVFAGVDILLTVLSKLELLVLGDFVCEAEGN